MEEKVKAEEKIKTEYVTEEKPASAEPRDKGRGKEKLKNLSDSIKQIEKGASARRAEREKNLADTSVEAERRIAEARVKMEEKSTRAKQIAQERAARLEYSGEYRQRLAKREEKIAKQNEQKAIEAEREERQKKTAAEIEEFRRIEAERAAERRRKAEELFKKLSDKETKKDESEGEEAVADGRKADLPEEPDSEGKTEKAEEPKKAEKTEKAEETVVETVCRETEADEKKQNSKETEKGAKGGTVTASEANGKIILNINQGKKTPLNCGGDNVIRMGASFVVAGGSVMPKQHRTKMQPMKESVQYTPEAKTEKTPYELPPEEFYSNNEPEYTPVKDEYAYGGETVRDESYLAEYESYNEHKKQNSDIETELLLAEYEQSLENEKNGHDLLFASNMKEPFAEGGAYLGKDMMSFTKNELIRHLNSNHRKEVKLLKKLRLSEKEQRYATHEKNSLLIVEKIGIQKEIVELASESLVSCVYAADSAKIQKYKKELVSEIANYNQLCDEYEAHAGKALQYISVEMADDIIAGKVVRPIQNVFYVGDHAPRENAVARTPEPKYETASFWDLELSDREMGIVLGDGKISSGRKSKRAEEKQRELRMGAVKTAAERDLLVIGLRYDCKIARLEAERDMLYNTFTTNQKKKDKAIQAIEKKIDRQKKLSKRALKVERDDNARYYSLVLIDRENEKIKDGANRERLEALRMRLDVLLAEREVINEELITLYGGKDKKLNPAKINRKLAAVRRKHARAMYRSQRKIAEKMRKYRAPDELKEKAFVLLNHKTKAVVEIEEAKYKMSVLHLRGKAQKELYQKIRREKRKIKRLNSDIHFIMHKLRRHEERFFDDRQWAITLITIATLAIAAIGAYTFFGEQIRAFFVDFYNKFIVGG